MDNELDGVSFVAQHKQYYTLEVPVDIIRNRNTDSMPCIQEGGNFDESRNKVTLKTMMEDIGCVVPYIERSESVCPICTNKTKAKTAEHIYGAYGNYYDLYRWDRVPLPCKHMHVEPRKTFESLDWFNRTWISARFMKIGKVTEQQAAYSFSSFYAEVGGFVGLLLGISLHQIGLLLDFIPEI